MHLLHSTSSTNYAEDDMAQFMLDVHTADMASDTKYRLKEWREHSGLSQDGVVARGEELLETPEFSGNEKMGWSQSTYARIEKSGNLGRRYVDKLTRLLAAIHRVPDEALQFTPQEWSDQSIASSKNSDQNITANSADILNFRLPASLKRTHIIPVIGKVEAGAWRTMSDDVEPTGVVEVELPEYRGKKLYAHDVEGDSIDEFVPHGGRVIFVDVWDAIGGLQQDDYVLVRKPNGAGQYEITVKQLKVRRDGTYELWPRSSNPKYKDPFIIPPRNEDAQDGITIYGVVVDRRLPKVERSGVSIEKRDGAR